ncbi:Salicylate hydroxylase [Cercospora zeina]
MTNFIPIENVQFNKRLVDVEDQSNGVSMTFPDGTTATATVLAAADGIQSALREHVLKSQYPNEVAPVYAGAYCYRAVIPIAEAREILGDLTDVAKIYFGHKRSVVTYRISGGEEFNFLHCVADPEEVWKSQDSVTEKTTHETMMKDFEGAEFDDRVRQLLSKANPIKWGLFHHQHTSTYFRDRVVLTGDSAHASLPFQAAGASQGLEDALVLSNVLAELGQSSEHGTIPVSHIRAGLSAYDSVRRPRAQKQLDQAAEVGRMIFFQHEEAGSDMNKILSKLQNEWFDWLWFHDVSEDVQKALNTMREEISDYAGATGT